MHGFSSGVVAIVTVGAVGVVAMATVGGTGVVAVGAVGAIATVDAVAIKLVRAAAGNVDALGVEAVEIVVDSPVIGAMAAIDGDEPDTDVGEPKDVDGDEDGAAKPAWRALQPATAARQTSVTTDRRTPRADITTRTTRTITGTNWRSRWRPVRSSARQRICPEIFHPMPLS